MKGIIRGKKEDGKGSGRLKNGKRKTSEDDLIVRDIWTITMIFLNLTMGIGILKRMCMDPVLDGWSSSLANHPMTLK
jgi:hypothetical protein